jgi:ABC-2 type transport system ATP-binding protein
MIELENVSKSFGPVQAVCDLSLRVETGELFCFLGPNGAGKTTTIKMMCGLLRPTQGTIRLGGADIRRDPVAARRITGYIPDFPFLYDRLTATEFFEFTGDLYGVPRERTARERADSFERFGLVEYRDTLVKDLSHGLRQRLIYTVTLLHRPAVLFVDEPFVGLDPFSIRLIKDLLRAKAREGMTIFLTTHILALIEDLADRIGIIVNGRLVALGTQKELATKNSVEGGRLEDVFFRLAT